MNCCSRQHHDTGHVQKQSDLIEAVMETRTAEPESADCMLSFQNSQGLELQATLLKLRQFQAAFEIYSPAGVLRMSEVLDNFKIVMQEEVVYSGRAVVNNLIQLNSVLVCEATLDESSVNLSACEGFADSRSVQSSFERFIRRAGRSVKVHPEFKLAIADMETFFMDLRLWMEQTELGLRSQPAGDRLQMERELLSRMQNPVLPAVAPVLEKFEALANRVEADLQPCHRAYMKRRIHPLVMCSPFLYRTFQKPLGYAGDYEMVNMMLRDPFEGSSTFAKLVNRIFLNTPPVLAHQERIAYLTQRLAAETKRVVARGSDLQVFNLGCGPAKEIQDFLRDEPLSDKVQLTLLDFNDETLAYTAQLLRDTNARYQRKASTHLVKRSVQQILKDAGKGASGPKYDLVYCAGLLDYLSEQVCRRLINYLYQLVAPGGLLICTNVSVTNPSRNWMEYILDWHLLYRSAAQMHALAPDGTTPESCSVQAIGEGVNISLEVRKPADAN
jgi:extracellular factor (EF) 3-hydroxypalmitic acid methyl ester biosynthesis protein